MTAVIVPRRANRRATLIVALVLLTSTVTARADKVDDYVKAQMEAFHLPGLSLVVIKDGKIVKSAGYGLAKRREESRRNAGNRLQDWDSLLYTARILTESTRREMWTPVRLNSGSTHPYGLGWHVDSTKNGKRVWHGGGLPGFVSYFVRYLDHGLSVVTLTNGDDVDMQSIANGVAALYLPSQ
jgi:CubicO group peptidase (beta-lactamase class C family)